MRSELAPSCVNTPLKAEGLVLTGVFAPLKCSSERRFPSVSPLQAPEGYESRLVSHQLEMGPLRCSRRRLPLRLLLSNGLAVIG